MLNDQGYKVDHGGPSTSVEILGISGLPEAGDIFKLADWNGDLNGGNYHVIFIDMSASW